MVGRDKAGIHCVSCDLWFHAKCVELSKAAASALSAPGSSWKCPGCRSSSDNRRRTMLPHDFNRVTAPVPTLDAVYEMVREIRSELRDMKANNDELIKSVQFCSDQITDFEILLKEKCKLIDGLSTENALLRKQVDNLSTRVADLEQYSRRNNLEIQGIPEKSDENITQIINKIGDFLEIPLKTDDIDAVHRVPQFGDKSRPKNIIVRFCNRTKRDSVLAAAVVKRRSLPKGSRPGFAIEGLSQQCFINEHLTVANKKLFGTTRAVAREKNYKYIWTRNCKILVRKNDSSRVIQINSDEDLRKLE
nr:uncharacterized protein LOC111422955 [Onthophagus taurus]